MVAAFSCRGWLASREPESTACVSLPLRVHSLSNAKTSIVPPRGHTAVIEASRFQLESLGDVGAVWSSGGFSQSPPKFGHHLAHCMMGVPRVEHATGVNPECKICGEFPHLAVPDRLDLWHFPTAPNS